MHKTSVISYSDRAKAVCTCGQFEGRELVGRGSAKKAVLEAKKHLAEVEESYVMWSFDSRTSSYYAGKDIVTEREQCPSCYDSLDMVPDLFNRVSCESGHKFILGESTKHFHLKQKQKRSGSEVIDLEDDENLCPVCSSKLKVFFETLSQVQDKRVVYCDCRRGHSFVAQLLGASRARLYRRGQHGVQ